MLCIIYVRNGERYGHLRIRPRQHRRPVPGGANNETQIRREFIDPFCKALGWDIDNEQGYAEAYKDVVHEDAIKISGSTKAPDYAFRTGGTRKFFLEAKKPSVNIKTDISPAFQLRRYAWSAKLPLSILTDFEEFAVYDCRIKPEKTDKASTARVSYYTYEDYIDKWDEIAAIFSREAIYKGSFDKYAEDNKRKHGTAEVDDAFLQEIESWREALARNVALRNSGLTIAERRRILLTHIYGVDIDPQAVEVTKLSLLLKVLEGETADAIARQMDMFNLRALPDLVANIRCGNSLVASDFYKSYQINLFDADQQLKVNVFDWRREFPFYAKSGGFQFVIGNPPYLYSAGQEFAEYFKSHYSFSQYQTDYFVYFVEAALRLLREGGTLGFIIPDSWLNSENFSTMRQRLFAGWAVDQICTFTFKVFKKANIENSILIASNKPLNSAVPIITFTSPTESALTNTLLVEDIKRLGIVDPFYQRDAEDIIRRMDKCAGLGRTYDLNRGLHAYRPDGYGQSAFGAGPQTKRDQEERSYHSATRKNKTYLPEIRGRDVFWLHHRTSGEFIAYGKWLAEPREPRFMTSPKLVCRKTLGNVLSLALVEEPAAIDQSLYIILHPQNDTAQLNFALAVLGSSLGAWYLRTKYAIYDKLHPWYTKKNLEQFPLPKFDSKIVATVDRLLKIEGELPLAKIESDRHRLENERNILVDRLDAEVFAAFGLTATQGAFVRHAVGRE
jgi:predicted type IV restriction endonuclease